MNEPAKLPATGKREQQKEARRCAIIDAALAEFTAQGFTSAKLDDVAVRAGIGKGTIYLYFDSKESLFEAVVRTHLIPDEDMAAAYMDSMNEGSAADVLARHFRHMYAFLKHDKVPPLLMMIQSETARFPKLAEFFYQEMIRPSQEVIRHILRKGVASGEFRADAEQVHSQLLFAPVMHSALWNLTYGNLAPLDLDQYAETHIDFMLRALRP